ncbi:MAG: tetratricopeptide repeat protein [Aquificae bacterium]|nr:tetratricopeptide repeat protein [Aquificota bacterium]
MKKKYLLTAALLAASCAPMQQQQNLEQRLSELELRVARLEEQQKLDEERFREINRRLDLLAQKLGREELERVTRETLAEKREEVKEEEERERPPSEVEEHYRQALSLYQMKRLYEARDAFIEFLKTHGPNELTDNAYFWLGKIYYELGNKERARQLLLTLVKKCENGELPDCNKLPDAYLVLAKMALEEGNEEEARKYLSILEERFPDAEATERARALFYREGS